MTRYHLYFAYGSNLDAPQMLDRCPSAVTIATGSLNGYRLAFSGWSHGRNGGVANVRRSSKSDKVRGLIWEISDRDLQRLDSYEGYPAQYTRKLLTVVDRHGRRLKCWVYIMAGKRTDARPSMDYFTLIAAAYQVYGFSLRRLNTALLRAPVRSAPIRALPGKPKAQIVSRPAYDDFDREWIEWVKTTRKQAGNA